MFFTGQNLKHVLVTCSFLELLISFLSTLVFTDVEKPCLLCGVKIPYQQFLTFLSFMNIFRNNCLQMFLKIGALKNFTIF